MEIWHIPVLILSVPVAFMFTVIIHEYGHWIGGLFSGYRTVYICLFSFVFYKDAEGKHRNARYRGMIGQCIMVPRSTEKQPKPDDLIAGGPAASLVAGLITAAVMFVRLFRAFSDGQSADISGAALLSVVLFGIFATMNLTFGITNLIPRGTNDGANLREIRKSDANRRAYNRLMEVYMNNVYGVTFRGMPNELLKAPEGSQGSMADELGEYAKIKKEVLEYMKRSEPEPRSDGKAAEPDMKAGSWELWQQCRKDAPEKVGRYLGICRRHMKKDLGLGEWRMVEELMIRLAELNRIDVTEGTRND